MKTNKALGKCKRAMLLIFLMINIFLPNGNAQDYWLPKANLGTSQLNSFTFTINGKGYSNNNGNIWEYDPISNSWSQLSSFPGVVRNDAAGFALGNKGYMGTGMNQSNTPLNDFWEFDPAANTWMQKNNFSGPARYGAIGFSIGNKGYLGLGNSTLGGTLSRDIWEYDPTIDSWSQKQDFPGQARTGLVEFTIGPFGYIGGGASLTAGEQKSFYKYDPNTNIWTQITDYPHPIVYPTSFTISNRGFVCSGNQTSGLLYNDLWAYDTLLNQWIQKASFPGSARFSPIGFSINNNGYVGGGSTGTSTPVDFWQYVPDSLVTSVDLFNIDKITFSVFPNPASDYFNLRFSTDFINCDCSYAISNAFGQRIVKGNIIQENMTIDIGPQFSPGIYFISIVNRKNKVVGTKKVVIF